jgi:N utilization substance protein A
MNGELLLILESIARDKGIDKEVLIKAIESSLVGAARKSSEPIAKKKNIIVHIDREKGNIKALAELMVVENNVSVTLDEIHLSEAKKIKNGVTVGETIQVDLTPKDFGRIAAQSAKQIIIQKIREAERDVVFEEYKDRVNDITMGTIRRKEKGNIIIDLGKAEATLPLKEQCPDEVYHVGDRIRTYISDVKAGPKGPEITLSRTHPGLVRRLFELEVPEIVDGTIEIKGIVREPGFRCKVSVASTDSKVDPIGACVGMRGSRIKNIVRELENEKLDIIKWESDISKYVINALSPAEIANIIVSEKEKKVEVRVTDDQLSIAIGKRGQNVRLASRLTGWEIDIRKIEETAAPKSEAEKPETKEEAHEEEQSAGTGEFASMLEITDKKAEILLNAGLDSVEKIANADISQLTELEGFGEKTAEKIKEKAQNLLKGEEK